jgi:MFS family permease
LTSKLVFQPSFASFSNIFGRRPVILVAIALFLAGAIIAGVSNDFTHLLVGRSIQGVGGGGIIALTEVVVTDIVPLRHRGQYFGVFSGMWAIGSVSGPILGGAFSQNVTWVREITIP